MGDTQVEARWDTSVSNLFGLSEASSLFQAVLPRFTIMNGQNDPVLDNLVALTARLCDAPVAAINLISQEQQIFKAVYGLTLNAPPPGHNFCRQTLLADDIFIVSDASTTPLFASEPFVTGTSPYRFYAGIKLAGHDGTIFGTMLILDKKPRHLSAEQLKDFRRLAQIAGSHMEMQARHHRQQHKEQLNQLIIDNALDYAIITTTLSGQVTSWNAGARRLFGWTEEEVLKSSVDILFTPEEREKNVPEMRRVSALHHKQDAVERWHMRKDGSRFWASGQLLPLYDQDGHMQGFLKILMDRTFVREQQERLREQEEMLRLSQEAGGIGAFDINLISRTITVTNQIRQIYGIAPDTNITIELFEKLMSPRNCDEHKTDTAKSGSLALPRSGYSEYLIHRLDNNEQRWVALSTELISDDQGAVVRMRGIVQDITNRKHAEEQQAMLTAELAHRSKNILAVIQGIANQTLRSTTSAEDARAAFEARIMALSKAQDVLTQGAKSVSAELADIVTNSLSVHAGAGEKRISISGIPVTLGSRQALSMVMALHELGTNAVKYGALSTPDGHIEINWRVENGRFRFYWIEKNGPQVEKPARRGFGSRLIERTLAASLGGSAELHYLSQGLEFRLDAPANNMRYDPA
ncbi:PAS domain S-box protein [Pseudochrobactrum sp. B5]|uniref:PAS domain S-box protein n=1 Tax=Pseudochrobactrum sp. B5 TaxID=1289478 RepID=UPI0009F83EEE|nr:PAS domain S-box protein [Pseudochrobactrum sp. B5]